MTVPPSRMRTPLKTSNDFSDPLAGAMARVRLLGTRDLAAYKSLRDAMLLDFPDAFTSDASTETPRPPDVYLGRFGVGHGDPATFTLGAFERDHLIGAISCEREPRPKVLHLGHVVGMMVRPEHGGRGVGRALMKACIDHVRAFTSVQQLTLTVTSGNTRAVQLYERAGFVRYGTLPRAMRIGDRYVDKDLMLLQLGP